MANKKYYGYKSWTDYLLDNPSEPIDNNPYLFGICSESRKLMLPNESVIKFHQRKLGKENFIWTGSVKNYVWELMRLRIFVNKDGRNIEFCPSTTDNDLDLIKSLQIYKFMLDIELPLEQLHIDNYKFEET
jgi:hypothetical protein